MTLLRSNFDKDFHPISIIRGDDLRKILFWSQFDNLIFFLEYNTPLFRLFCSPGGIWWVPWRLCRLYRSTPALTRCTGYSVLLRKGTYCPQGRSLSCSWCSSCTHRCSRGRWRNSQLQASCFLLPALKIDQYWILDTKNSVLFFLSILILWLDLST